MPTKTQAVSATVFANPQNIPTVIGIDQNELKRILSKNKGASAVTIVARTELDKKMRKTGNPLIGKGFTKVSRVNGMIGWHYANAVNNQRKREGLEADFVVQPRKWGTRIEGTPLVEHKGAFYLELKVEKSLGHRYEDSDGNEIDDNTVSKIKSFLPVKKQAATQQTEKEIVLRDYKLDTILSITYRGTCYLIR